MSKKQVRLEDVYTEGLNLTQTWSGIELKRIYGPEDILDTSYPRDLGDSGDYPFTRGVHRNMYRGRLWTRREAAGYGTALESNKRFLFQAAEGVSGLSFVPDHVVEWGIDSDHPLAVNEVGITGVPFSTVQDMEDLMSGIAFDGITMSNPVCGPPAAVTTAFYIVAAEKMGADKSNLKGTTQNCSLHVNLIYEKPNWPVDLGLKLAVDLVEYCTRHMPLWYCLNVNQYDMRETGITAVQEVAFGLALAEAYVEKALERGLNIDDFARRIAFYVSSHIDLFEEVAKIRAERRMWARLMKEKYKAKDPKSWMFRFGVHTAGSSLVPQEPLNNIVRVAYEALAALLGGAQSLHTCSYDEPIALPTETSNKVALRTQEILAFETSLPCVADPLGGSYYVETLTNQLETQAQHMLDEINQLGGAVAAIKAGWFRGQVEHAMVERQKELETGKRKIIGVNLYAAGQEKETPGGFHSVSRETMDKQIENVRRYKRDRDFEKVRTAIMGLREQALKGEAINLMPSIIDAARSCATLGEIVGTIRETYGYSYDPLGVVHSPFSV